MAETKQQRWNKKHLKQKMLGKQPHCNWKHSNNTKGVTRLKMGLKFLVLKGTSTPEVLGLFR